MFNKKLSPTSFWWIFYSKYLTYSNLDMCIYSFIITWLLEWIYLIEYTLNFWSYTRIIYPYRLPLLLIVCFIYWSYIWGVSIWRRTLHGRFTRGDRKLWFKGFASFWVVELSTILGVFAAACWMSWGPIPLMPRYFLMQKKSFLFELTLFTYVVWLIYLMRMGIKWHLWKTQALISFFIILLLSCLLWRDLITLYTRDVIDVSIGAKWRYVKLNSVIYSMSNIWWTEHFIGDNKSVSSLFTKFNDIVESNFVINPFENIISKTEYERYHWLPITLKKDFNSSAFLITNPLNEYSQLEIYLMHNDSVEYMSNKITLDSYKFYPRKIGFYPKKIAMWYFLVVLKIWHHIMLYIWWFFYLLRLNTKKKSSYTLLSVCYFNVYCCFLICLLIYCYNLLPVWENFLRIKPLIRSKIQNWSKIYEGFIYCLSIFAIETGITDYRDEINEWLSYSFLFFIADWEGFWFVNNVECLDDFFVWCCSVWQEEFGE